MARRLSTGVLLSPFLLWFVFFVLGPLGILIRTSLASRDFYGVLDYSALNFGSYKELFTPLYLAIFLKTGLFAFINMTVCLVVAIPVAFFISRLKGRNRALILALILIPFWTSFLVRVLSVMDLLHDVSFFGDSLLYSSPGVLFSMVYNYLPFALLPLYATMEKIEDSWLEAARDLGANRIELLFKVVLPLAKPGILSAGLFVFIPSLGEFLIPALVGGGKKFFLGTFLQNQFMNARNWPLGAAAICVLVFFTLAAVLMIQWVGARDVLLEKQKRNPG